MLKYIVTFTDFFITVNSETTQYYRPSMLMLLQRIVLGHSRVKGSRPPHKKKLHQHITAIMGV